MSWRFARALSFRFADTQISASLVRLPLSPPTEVPIRQLLLAIVSSFSVCMVACGTTPKGLLTSLEDITAEVHRQGFIDVNQNRIMSLAGLLAPPHPGRLYRYKDSRAPSTAIGITTTEPSHYIVSTAPIPAGADVLANLATMRGKMLAVRQRAAVTIAARLALAHARRAAENDAASPPLAKVL